MAPVPYRPEHAAGVRRILTELGWERRYVDGQLDAVARLSGSPDGCVYVVPDGARVLGYVSAVYHAWNRLGQIHGLAVLPEARRHGVGGTLVDAVEQFLRGLGARGVHLDTPVDNELGRRFYEAIGYTADHVMTRYYADDLDGVTYLKFFSG